jgi:hypothetical protein
MITKSQFDLYNQILKQEEKMGLKDYMTKTIAMISAGKLTSEDCKEIMKNYLTYEKQYGNQNN